MFEQYSDRAKHVIFLTRLKAGRRGAPSLDTVHLIEALILEDQGKFADAMGYPSEALGRSATSPSRPSVPFFAPETASAILLKLQLPPGEAIPDSVDMPMSPALKRAFAAAMALRTELHHKKVEPLHLLAAVLSEQSDHASEALRASGLTREAVLAAIKDAYQ